MKFTPHCPNIPGKLWLINGSQHFSNLGLYWPYASSKTRGLVFPGTMKTTVPCPRVTWMDEENAFWSPKFNILTVVMYRAFELKVHCISCSSPVSSDATNTSLISKSSADCLDLQKMFKAQEEDFEHTKTRVSQQTLTRKSNRQHLPGNWPQVLHEI